MITRCPTAAHPLYCGSGAIVVKVSLLTLPRAQAQSARRTAQRSQTGLINARLVVPSEASKSKPPRLRKSDKLSSEHTIPNQGLLENA